MSPSAIVALCLLAVTSAAPSSWNIECVTSCLPSATRKYSYELGKTYTYAYKGKSSVKLSGKGSSDDEWSTEVQMTQVSPCNFAISIKDPIANTQAEKYPLVVGTSNYGRIEKVCHHPEDDHESINLKKGVAAALQNVLTSFSEPSSVESVMETDVFGKCPTTYTVETNGDTTVVTKEKNQNECELQFSGIPRIPNKFSWNAFPLWESKSTCRQEVRNCIYTSISCIDKKTVLAAYGAVEAIQESKLQLVSESIANFGLNSIQGITLVRTSMKYESKSPQKNSALVEKFESTLSNICSMIQGQASNGVAHLLTQAIKLLKYVPEETVVESLNNIRSGKFCTDYGRLEALYLDAIAFVGESGTLKVIAQEVAAGRVTGGREALYTAALHLIWTPKVHHIAAMKPIFAIENPTSPLLLAAATVVNNYCEGNSACQNEVPVKEIMEILANKLDTQCTPAFSKEKPVVVLATLKALGNIGHMSTEFANKIVKCVKTEGVEVNVRFAASMAVKAAPCMQEIKEALLPVVYDQRMNTEVRIGSYLASVKCSSVSDLQNIVNTIKTDTNKQVHAFVLTHLSNLQETNWPMKQKLKDLLINVDMPQSYKSNLFKYSRNIEMSYDSPVLGLGAEVDSNIVYVPESYIPRILSMELNMNSPVSRISGIHKISEVGARVEGLDHIFEKAFGQESYLHNTPLQSIIKDISLFVQQNGVKLYKELEALLNQKRNLNLHSKVKSVLSFLEDKSIKLPKADLYAKLMGQEWAFFTTAGPMQEIHFNNVMKAISAAVAETIVGVKDLNLNTARAAHLHFLYDLPTIQGIPLVMNFETTAVTTIELKTNMESNALIKIIPSIHIAIGGYIGYGNKINNGIKMKHSIYTTNGLSINGVMNNEEIELKIELPENMELININSEVFLMKTDVNLYESRVQPVIKDTSRILKQECFNIIESVTGLNICYNVNIPFAHSASFPLQQAFSIRLHLQKSDAAMKGYRLVAKLKNKPNNKALKIVAGTYGSASSSETIINMAFNKFADKSLATLNIQSANMDSSVEATIINQADYAALQVAVNHKYGSRSPLVVALKFDLKKDVGANGNEYKLSALAGLSKSLSKNDRFLFAKFRHVNKGQAILVDFTATSEIKVLPLTIEFGVDLPVKALWGLLVRTVGVKIGSEQVGATLSFKYLNGITNYKTISEINVPSLMKPVKIIGALVRERNRAAELLNFEALVSVEMGNAAVLHIEGPVSIAVNQEILKQQLDLKVSGAFEGFYKIKHAIMLSCKKIQHTLDVRYGSIPVIFLNFNVDHTSTQEISLKFVNNVPILGEVDFATVISSGLIRSTMNTLILPTTSATRRLKGYVDFNYAENKINGDLYWNAGKDNSKKLSFVMEYSLNYATGSILIRGDLDIADLPYGFRIEAAAGSPLKFFLGTNGFTLTLALPSNKIVIVKSICNIEYRESVLILKPLVALYTVNEHKYEISGKVALKKLPTLLNFDISNEWTISTPEIEKVTVVSKLTHEDKNARCLIVFKSGIAETTLGQPIDLEISYDASTGKYSWFVIIKVGSSTTKVSTNVAADSEFSTFEVNVDAVLPLATANSLGWKVVKRTDGTLTANIAKLKYIMASITEHTISFECPSRIIELNFFFTGNEMIIKVFPKKNMSSRMSEIVIKVTKKAGAGLIELFVNTPSLSREMRIAAEVAPAASGSILNVDIQFPVSEVKTFLRATVEELKNILKDLVNDGILPELPNLIEMVMRLFVELIELYETIKAELSKLIFKYYTTMEKAIKQFWRNYKGDIITLWSTLRPEVIYIWRTVEVEVPAILNNFRAKIQKAEFWKLLVSTYEKIIARYPEEHAAVVNFYHDSIIPTVNELKAIIRKLFNMPTFGVAEIQKFLWTDVPTVFNDFVLHFKSTSLYHILREKASEFIASPTTQIVYAKCIRFFNEIRLLYVENTKEVYENLMKIPSIRKIVEYLTNIIMGENINMDMTLETLASVAHVVVTELWGITYKISNDRLTAVVPFPVPALTHFWKMMTINFPAFVYDIIAIATVELETIRAWIPEVASEISKHIPVVIKYIKTEVPVMLNEVLPGIINFVEVIIASSPVKFLKTKINELIAMYPAEYKAFKDFVFLCITISVEYITYVYELFMEIPVVKQIGNWILNIFPSKHVHVSLGQSVSSYTSSLSSYVSSSTTVAFIKHHVPELSSYISSSSMAAFIKHHTPAVVGSVMSSLASYMQ